MKLVINCFNGFEEIIEQVATHEDLVNLAKRRERQGYTVDWLSPNQIEVNSDGLIDDRMGIVTLTK